MFKLSRPGAMPLFRSVTQGAVRPQFFAGNVQRMSTQRPKKLGLKELAKQYGWVGTGVYLGLSAIDLPIFYLIVHNTGNEWIVDSEKSIRKWIGASTDPADLYVTKALESDKGQFMAEFSVAYVIHKCFLVVRVPVTVAITPWVANKLGQYGFKVTKGLPVVDKAKLTEKIKEISQK